MRTCLKCSEKIPETKRTDSKFCSSSCKARYWEERKESKNETTPLEQSEQKVLEKSLSSELRGVIDPLSKSNVNPVTKPAYDWIDKQVKVETEDYKLVKKQHDYFETEIKKLATKISQCDAHVNNLRNGNPVLVGAAALAASFVANNKTDGDLGLTLGGAGIGVALGLGIDALFFKEARKKPNEEIRAQLEEQKNGYYLKQLHYLNQLELAQNGLATTPQFEQKTKRVLVKREPLLLPLAELSPLNEVKKIEIQNSKPNRNETAEVQTNENIITSRQLRDMNYQSLDFGSVWFDFFGQPAIVFHTAVHGKPGEGKSTFCFQFANYLAENFGRVIYVSGEEGLSKTLQDKLINTQAESTNLYFANCSSFEHIIERVEKDKFHFLFIDWIFRSKRPLFSALY